MADILRRRGITSSNISDMCILCRKEGESVDHLFIARLPIIFGVLLLVCVRQLNVFQIPCQLWSRLGGEFLVRGEVFFSSGSFLLLFFGHCGRKGMIKSFSRYLIILGRVDSGSLVKGCEMGFDEERG